MSKIHVTAERKPAVEAAMSATGLPYPGFTAVAGGAFVADDVEGLVLDAAVSAGATVVSDPAVSDTKKLTPEQRGEAFSGSAQYAAGRMTHAVITCQDFSRVQSEVVHDALMAAFQAGYLAAASHISVDELLRRRAEID